MAVLARSRIEAHYVVIIIGIEFHANFVFGARHAQPLEIQQATGVIDFIVLAAYKLLAVYPYGFRIRDDRDIFAFATQGIAFALAVHPRKRTHGAIHLVGTYGGPNIRIVCPKSNHTAERGPFQREKSQVGILPEEVAKMEHPVPGCRLEIDLVHLLERRRRLVARAPIHIAQQRIYHNAVAHGSLDRKLELLVDLRVAIAHGHLHGLVAMRLEAVLYMRRIGRDGSIRLMRKDIRIPYRERINIERKGPPDHKGAYAQQTPHRDYLLDSMRNCRLDRSLRPATRSTLHSPGLSSFGAISV